MHREERRDLRTSNGHTNRNSSASTVGACTTSTRAPATWLVVLHGNLAWGFLSRKFMKALTAAGRHLTVPDTIGFGLSEKPIREQAHTLRFSHPQATISPRGAENA